MNNNVSRNEHNLVTFEWRKSLLWTKRFQNLGTFHTFARQYSNTKMNFSKRFPKFSSRFTLFINYDKTWIFDTLTSARLLGGR